MDLERLAEDWLREEAQARIQGWDFTHICHRYEAERELPWDYRALALGYLRPETRLLDLDTGGGEFLLSLGQLPARTAVTEGYPPNAALCRERLLPLGVTVEETPADGPLPFPDGSFDLILNRHGAFAPGELQRVLAPGGVFLTEQVGADNDRELTELLLPGTERPFPELTAARLSQRFAAAGLRVVTAREAYAPIRFFDVGALVWFARVIPWEFPDFSVRRCMEGLCRAQRLVETRGCVEGTCHRILLAAEKPGQSQEA